MFPYRVPIFATLAAILLWLPLTQAVEINSISNSSLIAFETLHITWTGGNGNPSNVTVEEQAVGTTGVNRTWFVAMNVKAEYADWVVNATIGSNVFLGVSQDGRSGSYLGRSFPVVASAAEVNATQTTTTSGTTAATSSVMTASPSPTAPPSGALANVGETGNMMGAVVALCIISAVWSIC
ncbi:hypothetical protein NliqN6_5158 [Naganishia liquefaciens]|uniref:DOMON domain-containing protein n=1 Tax=Naganishia liquefaciens TaxID=104408 RepID=A0A8H3TW99_9TREE|nr:hypothetical protein NliqN6_5158 [Naganishia liquefaciens]